MCVCDWRSEDDLMWLGFCLFVLFWYRILFLAPGCPATRSVDQAGLKLTEIRLPLPPECLGLKV